MKILVVGGRVTTEEKPTFPVRFWQSERRWPLSGAVLLSLTTSVFYFSWSLHSDRVLNRRLLTAFGAAVLRRRMPAVPPDRLAETLK